MAGYLRAVDRAHTGKIVLETHDMNTELYKRRFLLEKNPFKKLKLFLTWMPLRTWEARMAARFDLVVTVSEKDKIRFLSRKKGLKILVVPNGVDTDTNRPAPRSGRDEEILFVGAMDYAPNVDAVLYMYKEIFPRIRQKRPHCSLSIVGKEPPREIRRLGLLPGVTVAADVPDVRPYYRRARVAVVPILSGGGSRLKILESMALGTPVVSTSIGCEGLDVKNGLHLLVADRPDDFAACVDRLLTDVDLWEGLAREGRRLVEESYDWRNIAALFLQNLERLTRQASPKETI
jgi:glycosyltransferase involved in cell wall biosynthesis